jgi:hypothetical protein
MHKITDRVGELQLVTGIAHIALGLVAFRHTLAAIGRDGVVGVVEGRWEREAAFWYLASGAAFVVSGLLARWAQRRAGTLPAAYGVGLLALGLVGVAAMPFSGFRVVAANGLLALAAARAGDARAGGTGHSPEFDGFRGRAGARRGALARKFRPGPISRDPAATARDSASPQGPPSRQG